MSMATEDWSNVEIKCPCHCHAFWKERLELRPYKVTSQVFPAKSLLYNIQPITNLCKNWEVNIEGSLGFKSVPWRSPVRVPQISGPLEIYMVINFRAHKINRGTCKLLQIPTFKKKKKELSGYLWGWSLC